MMPVEHTIASIADAHRAIAAAIDAGTPALNVSVSTHAVTVVTDARAPWQRERWLHYGELGGIPVQVAEVTPLDTGGLCRCGMAGCSDAGARR